jgi:protein O-GlcNAc transferase
MHPQLQLMLQQAMQNFQDQKFDNADLILKKVLQLDSKNLPALHILGLIKASQGKFKESADLLGRAARINPNDGSLQYNLAKALSDSGNDKDAVTHHKKAVALTPNNSEAWFSYGKTASNLGRHEDALVWYGNALNLRPNYIEALLNKGAAFKELKRYEEAIAFADQVLLINPNLSAAWSNKGVALKGLERYEEAVTHFNQALSLKPDYAEAWSNKGVTLHELKRYEEAVTHFNQALSLKPDYAEAWSNKGVTLHELKRYEEAIAQYEKALSLKPDYAEAWSNKGVTLHELKRYEEAIAQYEKALSLKPDYAEAWSNKSNTLHELKRYIEAIAHYEKALSLKPSIDWILGDLIHIKMKIANWSNLASFLNNGFQQVIENQKVISPFLMLALNDNSLLHKKCAHIYAQNKYPANQALGAIPQYEKKEKIRIAYFSPDFRDHPVALLTAELFELHDREKFEVIAFSLFKTPVDDEVNLRLRKGFDRFIDVDGMTDLEVARLARELKVDIAIDLAGPTQHSRTAIFSYRAAPIQVNWLGYPGTIGADFIDYIIADKTVIPPSSQECYFEKVVYLPNTYMVDDSKRNSSTRTFTKYGLGLPEHGFIFCCFNSYQKYNPQILDRWSKLLFTVRDSALWITENNTYFKENLISEFEARGISRGRLVFAQRLDSMGDHLARLSLADLFLDTYPFNAHTTAIDALKAGLPVLTLKGESFASRVASSLLEAIGLPELVTTNQEAYEAMAIELATHPEKITDLRLRLSQNRNSSPLFDTPLFTKHLESAYTEMYKRYQAGLQPEQISIQSL